MMSVVCRGSQGNDEADFNAIMRFIECPQGCRQAQVAGTFEGRPLASNTNLLILCQGGCDVCDMRVKALRDMSQPAQRLLTAVQSAAGATIGVTALIEQLQVCIMVVAQLQIPVHWLRCCWPLKWQQLHIKLTSRSLIWLQAQLHEFVLMT